MAQNYRLCKLLDFNGNLEKRWCIEFYAPDEFNRLKRRQAWIPAKYKTKADRLKYYKKNAVEINLALIKGFIIESKVKSKTQEKPEKQPPSLDLDKITIVDAFNFILSTKATKRKKTIGTYKTHIKCFFDFLTSKNSPDYPLKHFGKTEAYMYSDYLKINKQLSNLTHNNR